MSPIEEALAEWFAWWEYKLDEMFDEWSLEPQKRIDIPERFYGGWTYPARHYVLDFLFTETIDGVTRQLAIECDSEEWHASWSAATADRDRDRDMLSVGIPTIRFTGSRILTDGQLSAYEAMRLLRHQIDTELLRLRDERDAAR